MSEDGLNIYNTEKGNKILNYFIDAVDVHSTAIVSTIVRTNVKQDSRFLEEGYFSQKVIFLPPKLW